MTIQALRPDLAKATQELPELRKWLLDYLTLSPEKRKRKYARLLPKLNSRQAERIAWVLDCAKQDSYAKALVELLRRPYCIDVRRN